MNAGKPTFSIFELGCATNVVAGMEYADEITRPVETAHYRIAGLWDSPDTDTVKSYLRDLDVAIESLKNDAQKNVSRVEFLQSLNEWLFGWKKFYGSHSSTPQILLAGRDATMNQAREYQKQLEGWRDAFRRETGRTPEGMVPTKPPEVQTGLGLSTSTKILLGVGALGAVFVAGYLTYRYVKRAAEDVRHAEGLARGMAERAIGAHAVHGLRTEGE